MKVGFLPLVDVGYLHLESVILLQSWALSAMLSVGLWWCVKLIESIDLPFGLGSAALFLCFQKLLKLCLPVGYRNDGYR